MNASFEHWRREPDPSGHSSSHDEEIAELERIEDLQRVRIDLLREEFFLLREIQKLKDAMPDKIPSRKARAA